MKTKDHKEIVVFHMAAQAQILRNRGIAWSDIVTAMVALAKMMEEEAKK